jgi:hypothetical protein
MSCPAMRLVLVGSKENCGEGSGSCLELEIRSCKKEKQDDASWEAETKGCEVQTVRVCRR